MRTAVMICLSSFLAAVAVADVGPKPRETAGGIELTGKDLEDVTVAMTAEEVNLVLEGEGDSAETLHVEATFHMKNDGPDVSLEEGFPIGPVKNMSNFAVKIDGEDVKPTIVNRRRRKGGGLDDFWYVWEATYKSGTESVRAVTYSIGLTSFSEYRTTGYVLHTGAAWKGPIGKAVVTLRCKGTVSFGNISALAPTRGAEFKGDSCVWTFEGIEPTPGDDISISYNDRKTWAEELAELREGAKTAWSPRAGLVSHLGDAPGREARERMTEAELADYLDALAVAISEVREKDGKHVLPATEPPQMDTSNLPPEAAQELRKELGNRKDPRPYMQSDDLGILTRMFDRAFATAKAWPESAKAKEVLQAYTNLCQWILDGTLYADEKKLEFHKNIREKCSADLKSKIEEASVLLKR